MRAGSLLGSSHLPLKVRCTGLHPPGKGSHGKSGPLSHTHTKLPSSFALSQLGQHVLVKQHNQQVTREHANSVQERKDCFVAYF